MRACVCERVSDNKNINFVTSKKNACYWEKPFATVWRGRGDEGWREKSRKEIGKTLGSTKAVAEERH